MGRSQGVKKLEILRCFAVFLFSWILVGSSLKSFADTEINLDDTNPTPTAVPSVPTPTPIPVAPAATPTPPTQEIQLEGGNQPATQAAPQPTSTVFEVQGRFKMKEMYEAGAKYYKEQDYEMAIRYWKQAVQMDDPYTPKFYYAEAYAMMGIIYQYHIIKYSKAYDCYRKARVYEPGNETARKHIRQVYKYRHRKD